MQAPPPPLSAPSEVVRSLRKIRNGLNRMKNEMKIFAIFIFRAMGENSWKIYYILGTKITITWTIKIWKLIFHSFHWNKKNLPPPGKFSAGASAHISEHSKKKVSLFEAKKKGGVYGLCLPLSRTAPEGAYIEVTNVITSQCHFFYFTLD